MAVATQSVPNQPSHIPHSQLVEPPMHIQENGQSHRRNKTLFHVGWIEVMVGGLSIILAIISVKIVGPIADDHYSEFDNINGETALALTYSSQGIWSGFFILIAGVLGILSLYNSSKCYYIFNVIIASAMGVIGCVAVFLSVWAALFCIFSVTLFVLHVTIGSLSALGVMLAIVQVGYSCGRICCSSNAVEAQQVVYTAHENMVSTQHTQYMQGTDNFIVNQQTYPKQSSVSASAPEKIQATALPYPQNIESPPSYDELAGVMTITSRVGVE